MSKPLNTRAAAAHISWRIIDGGKSLDAALAKILESHSYDAKDRAFIQELVYGVCRWYGALDKTASTLLRSPIRKKDRVVHFVLLTGLYQLQYLQTADHAAVAETVNACSQIKKPWAKNLINGCLRTHLRNAQNVDKDEASQLSLPNWILLELENAWPNYIDRITSAINQRPPLCLRINRRQTTRDNYLEKLRSADLGAEPDEHSADGIILNQAVPVVALPDFFQGIVSVQDTAAQLVCDFIQAEQKMSVLDACAAPGGKTAHILERADNQLDMTALDVSETRCDQLKETLARLGLNANVFCADASQSPTWSVTKAGYDRILIDAPCSGIGVIRRHPDIKHHRTRADIKSLAELQYQILQNLWPLLRPGGLLLYVTCSILPQENEHQIGQFVDNQNDAMLKKINHPNALPLQYGVQTLPGVHDMDGFYYSLITKA